MPTDIQLPEQKPVIHPLIVPNFHWDVFLREGKTLTGQKFNSALDLSGIKTKQDQSIIVALAEFYRNPGRYIEPYKEIRESVIVLQQLYFSFLCQYSPVTFVDITLKSELKAFPHNTETSVWVIGGNLLQWKKAVVEFSSTEHVFSTRFLMNCFLVIFRCNGYQTLWDGYSETKLIDGTFTLEEKS